ncbi:MAG: hypothetical protein H7A51_03625 [Akkermansiaceae bacterium]|nr:hypothetical protein [Akkermansiaceae bacterium]
MKNNLKYIALVVALMVAILTWFVVREPSANEDKAVGSEVQTNAGHLPANSSSERNRKSGRPDAWRLPFKLKPRLDTEQRAQLEHDPAAALEALMSTAEDPGFYSRWERQRHLLVAWAGRDPEAAIRWVNAREYPVGRAELLGAVAAGHMIHGGPEALQSFLAQYNEDPALLPKYQGNLDQFALRLMARADTISDCLEMLKESRNVVLAGALVEGIDTSDRKMATIDYFEAKGIRVEPNYWSLQTVATEDPRLWVDWAARRQSDLLPELIQSWNRQDPAAAKKWIEQTIPRNDPRRREIENLIRE